MKIYLQRNIFTSCHFQKHFGYQNNPPTFPEDSVPAPVAHSRKEPQYFSSLGKKRNYSAKRLPGSGGTDLELALKHPQKF